MGVATLLGRPKDGLSLSERLERQVNARSIAARFFQNAERRLLQIDAICEETQRAGDGHGPVPT